MSTTPPTPPPSSLEQTARHLCAHPHSALELERCILESARCNDVPALRVLRDHAFPVGKGLAVSLRAGHTDLMNMLAEEENNIFPLLGRGGSSLSLELWLAAAGAAAATVALDRLLELTGGRVRGDALFRTRVFDGAASIETLRWFLEQWRRQNTGGNSGVAVAELPMRDSRIETLRFLVGEILREKTEEAQEEDKANSSVAVAVVSELFVRATAATPFPLELAVLLRRGEFLPGRMAPTTAEDHRAAMEDAAGRPAALAFLLRLGTPWPAMHLPASVVGARDDCLELLLQQQHQHPPEQLVADPSNLRAAVVSALVHARYRAASKLQRRYRESDADLAARRETAGGATRSVTLLESFAARVFPETHLRLAAKKRPLSSPSEAEEYDE